MKFNIFTKPLFSGEYWDYTSEQDPLLGGLRDTYFKAKDIKFSLISAEKGTMYLFSTEQLRYNAQVRGIKDAKGNIIFKQLTTDESKVTYIGISEPVFDVFGLVIGYRHDLSQGLA